MKVLIVITFLVGHAFGKVYEFDQDNDGRVDFRLTYSNGDIKSKEIDYNLDGKFDFIQTFSVNEFLYITKIDPDYNGTFEVEKRARLQDEKIIVSSYRMKGKSFRPEGQKEINLLQAQSVNCVQVREQTISFFENFTNSFAQILSHTRNDFTNIEYNLSVHNSCYKNFKKDKFNHLVKDAVTRGISCLSTLAQNNKDARGRTELFNLLDMFKVHFEKNETNIELACIDEGLNWNSVAAYGSHTPGSPYGKHKLKHPFVILNPKFEMGFWGGISKGNVGYEKEEFQGIIFHEMIHNMGYSHGDGLDMSYTCEGCCFNEGELDSNDLVDEANVACRLCAGNYSNNLDEKYFEDLAKFEGKGDSYAFLQIFVEKNKEIVWNDRRVSSLLDYYFLLDERFGKSLAEQLMPLIQDEKRKDYWKGKIKDTWVGKSGEKVFNDSFAKFFKAYIIEGNEKKALYALVELKVEELLASRVQSSMSLSSHRVDKSIQTLKQLLREIHQHTKDPFLKAEISRFF